MPKRLLVALLISLAPLVAHADDTLAPSASPAATETPAPSTGALGPSSLNSGAGGSNADAKALQPAGNSPLQSTASDATGLVAPNTAPLQAPVTPGQDLKVLMGEADGTPHQPDGQNGVSWGWLWFTLLFALLAAAFVLAIRYHSTQRWFRRIAARLRRH